MFILLQSSFENGKFCVIVSYNSGWCDLCACLDITLAKEDKLSSFKYLYVFYVT